MTPSRRSAVEPFHAMDVLAEATRRRAAGRPVISLAVGQPSHAAPGTARAAAARALADGSIGYTDALGRRDLKEAIAAHCLRRYGVAVPPERIAATNGSSAAFNLAFLAAFDPGARIAITRPGYPAYRSIMSALGLQAVEIAVGAETGFTLTPAALDAAEAAHGSIAGVLLASPANPTGTVTGRAALAAVANHCRQRDIMFISDEIYHGLTFAGEEVSALELTDAAIVINSFSKYFCMTGWRIGWMVLPQALVRPVERLAQSLYISAPEIAQVAATAAFDGIDEMEAVAAGYRSNRQLLLDRLPDIGLDLASPMDGAFYAYVDVGRFADDSMALAARMLAEIDVAVTPGRDFDPVDGHRTLRLSYAGRTADIEAALDRIADWLGRPGAKGVAGAG